MMDNTAYLPLLRDDNGCWLWTGAINSNGYGLVNREGSTQLAHRWVYRQIIGRLDGRTKLDHLCRVRHCVNPTHVEPTTNRENTLRGEGPTAQNDRKTHCDRGHPFDEASTQINGRGRRQCRTCLAEQVAARTVKRRATMECPLGHLLDENNVRLTKTGGRQCVTCLTATIAQRAAMRDLLDGDHRAAGGNA